MRVSLNTVKQFTDVDLPSKELVDRINKQLGGVEGVVDLGERYEDSLIVRVVSAESHPDADRLTVCWIDDGGKRADVERSESGYVQVVCGAPNVEEGMLAVWLPPGSAVPASMADGQPFVLSARKLRGVTSNGMLASGQELAINNDHDGIISITSADMLGPIDKDSLVGASFSEVFGLDDALIDIENKMFTHRPDLFGQIGVAREIAGIQHKVFTSPNWYLEKPNFKEGTGLELEVFNDSPDKSARFMAVALNGAKVGTSPLWLQCELMRLGAKSINNIVDVTNYVMLMTAQPVHAYDYNKLKGKKLGVRMAKPGEEVTLINQKVYELDQDDIVIADGEGPVGLAGVMGGFDSEVSTETEAIVLEVAHFDMYSVRRSSMRHGLFTDALARFNKGQSPLQVDRVMSWLVRLLVDITGATQASPIFDKSSSRIEEVLHSQSLSGSISISAEFINRRLGLDLKKPDIERLLKNVEFSVNSEDGAEEIIVSSPYWRTDIRIPEDIVEEVGRLYGFDKLPRELPYRSIKPPQNNASRELKRKLREVLAGSGANEVLTYSFVHKDILNAAGQDPTDSYRLTNSLSPDLQYYRQSIAPSLVAHIHANIKAGYDRFGLFEFGKIHQKSLGLTDEGVPVEVDRLAFIYASKTGDGAAFYQAKRHLDHLSAKLGVSLSVQPISSDQSGPVFAPFEQQRSGQVVDTSTGRVVGVVGEFKKSVSRNFKLPEYAAGFEIDIDPLLQMAVSNSSSYQPLSRYPSVIRDVCFRVENNVSYAKLEEAVSDGGTSSMVVDVEPVDIYQPSDDSSYKQITFRFTFTDYEKTMTSEDVDKIISGVTRSAADSCRAEAV